MRIGFEWHPPPRWLLPPLVPPPPPKPWTDHVRDGPAAVSARVIAVFLLVTIDNVPVVIRVLYAILIVCWLGWELEGIRNGWLEDRKQADRRRDYIEHRQDLDRRYRYAHNSAPRWYPLVRSTPSARLDVLGGNAGSWWHVVENITSSAIGPVAVLDISRSGAEPSGSFATARDVASFVAPDCYAENDPLVDQPHPDRIAAELIAVDGAFGRDDDGDQATLSAVDWILQGRWDLRRFAAAAALLTGVHPDYNPYAAFLTDAETERAIKATTSELLSETAREAARRIYGIVGSVIGGRGVIREPHAPPLVWFRPDQTSLVAIGRAGLAESRIRRESGALAASLAGSILGTPADHRVAVVLGADQLAPHQLESLTMAARSSNTRLVTVFERFESPEVLSFVGSDDADTVIFRVGTAAEGEAAAYLIGKEVSFILASTSQAKGTSHSSSHSSNETYSQSRGSRSFETQSSRSTSFGHSSSTGRSQTSTETIARTEEFIVRPESLRTLPSENFIYRAVGRGQLHLTMGNCNSGISQLPETSPHPLMDSNSWWNTNVKVAGALWAPEDT